MPATSSTAKCTALRVSSAILMIRRAVPADRPRDAPRWSLPERSIWRLAATRRDRFASRAVGRGSYGLKPTYGLVPYTGICAKDHTLDHTGPMARTVADLATLLEVIAGPDGLDPRQRAGLDRQAYSRALSGDVKGLRLAIVKEGFGWEGMSEREVDEAVTEAAHAFERLGCRVATISIPWHRDGINVWLPSASKALRR